MTLARPASPTVSNSLKLILASQSPRRLDLLAQIAVLPDGVLPANIDETPHKAEMPTVYAFRMAREKAHAVLPLAVGSHILAADTVVVCGRRILPQAQDVATARQCLEMLSGRRHRVLSAVCLLSPDDKERCRLSTTVVIFKRLSASEISHYLDTADWQGKAGGYAIQGKAAAFVRALSGSYSGVVGLPLYETAALLTAAGFRCG